jgi:hypothetical protein
MKLSERLLSWTLALGWALLGALFAVAMRLWSAQHISLQYQIAIVVAGLLIGYSSSRILVLGLHKLPHLLLGALGGQIAAVPPAIQLGYWCATYAAQEAWERFVHQAAILAAFVAALSLSAVAALCVGTVLGMLTHATLRALLGLVPQWGQRLPALPRPGWRAFRISVLLGVLAGALFYADRRIGLPWPEATPPEQSAWIEREKALFREILTGGRHEILVLPVQAEEPSFDRIARSLMTRYLAYRVAERTGARTADPTLVARALDARARELRIGEAQRFAAALGARKMIAAGVQRKGQAFAFRAQVWTRDGDDAPWREGARAVLDGLPYHDRLPPSVTFRGEVDTLLDRLQMPGAKSAPAQSPPATAETAPFDDLLRLATLERASAIDRALHLQLVAALHERESIEAQTLWERSLVALWRSPQDSPLVRLLEARAYLHLQRRPYALERLGEPRSSAERVLLEVMNGNLPAAEAAAESIDHRALRLISEIELADLYDAYGLQKRLVARRAVVLDPPRTEAAVLRFRMSAPEWFSADTHGQLADAISRVTPLPADLRETAAAWLRWLYWLPDNLGSHNLRLARSIERIYPRAWKEHAQAWAAKPGQDRLAPWDHYELLIATNRRAVEKTVRSVLDMQGLPEAAVAIIEDLGMLFRGNPGLAYLRSRALERIGRKSTPGAEKRRYSESSALAVSVYRWEGGETQLSFDAEHYIYERQYRKYADEPIRWYRRADFPAERLQFERLSYSPQEMERSIASAKRRLEYSDRSAAPLRELVRWLRRAGLTKEASAVVEANQKRFVGTVARTELLAEAREAERYGEDLVPVYREMLELDPGSWDARWRLAKAYMESGHPVKTQETVLAYPGFVKPEGENIVGLSNRAFEAGYYLYRRGEPALGEPLFRLANSMRTWSAREIHARELVAIRESNLKQALEHARYQVDRYNDAGAGTRHVLYLFLLGQQEAAWAGFDAFVNRFGNEDIWIAAFVAHRMQGIEGQALEAWLAQSKSRDTRRDYLSGALRERHAFMLAMLDRPPAEEAVQHVRRAVRANNNSPFYPALAEGYVAFRRGDFAQAARTLRGPHNDLFNIGLNRGRSYSEWLPYLVYAYLRIGQGPEAEKILADQLANFGVDADYLMGRALIEGTEGRHEAAVAALKLAFQRLPFQETRVLHPGYGLLESSEILLAQSGEDLYRGLIEDFARRVQGIIPYSWAAAFEAKYAREVDARQLALAAASILDPKSQRIVGVPETERAAVRGAAVRHASALGAALRTR